MSPTQVLKYAEGPPLEGKLRTAWERFASFVETQPDKLALISRHQPSHLYRNITQPTNIDATSTCLRWTYHDLKEAINQLACQLRARGVQPGTVIVTLLPNGVESVSARLTASAMGCILAPLNPKHLVNKEEVAYLLRLFLRRSGADEADQKSAVVIAADEHIAVRIQEEQTEFINRCLVKILCPQSKDSQQQSEIGPTLSATGWSCFHDFMQDTVANSQLPEVWQPSNGTSPTDELIFCTSGTTSLPKACVWTTEQTSYHCHVLELTGIHELSPEDNVLVCLSNNHMAGYDALSSALHFGGTAVIPGPVFNVEEFIQATVQEGVTYTILVPTMVASVARSLPSPLPSTCKLRINLGGDIATPDTVDQCLRQIGAFRVYNTFGNTEGAFLKSGPLDVDQVRKSGGAAVGRPSPGQALKLHFVNAGHQGQNSSSGSVGELHLSSPGACSGYLGLAQSPAFYRDGQGRAWYATGDQARIDADGNITIIGRLKDMIIRGGENISPAAVEAVLMRSFPSLETQIVGVPDTDGLAGQVPVAVTKTTADPATTMAIRETVRKSMGAASCPEEVVSLAQLGLEDYPRTTSRKVKKAELAGIVRRYRVRKEISGVDIVSQDVVSSATFEKLRAIWAQILGVDVSSLSRESHMAELADSIAATRFLDRVSKAFGKSLTLAELTKVDTLRHQADLLDTKPASMDHQQSLPPPSTVFEHPTGPPGPEDMIHLMEDPEQFQATKVAVEKAIVHTGLKWDHVREVMSAHDTNQLSVVLGQMNRLNLRTCLIVQDPTISKEQLYNALEVVFANNTQLASFEVLFEYSSTRKQVLHVITTQTREFLEQHVFRDGGELDTVVALTRTATERQFPAHTDATFPGPLIKIDLFHIREIGSMALLINTNHSILDAASAQLFYQDLDAALTKPTLPLRPSMRYRPWLDSYYNLRSSPAAQAAVAYQVESLRDIGQHRHAIWPTHPPAYLTRQIIKKSSSPDGALLCTFDVPGFARLRRQYPGIGPHIPLKAAMATFLMRQTGHTHALFAHIEAQRTQWPFLLRSIDTTTTGDRSAADVRGQTLQTVVNATSIKQDETVLAFLKRMQAEQILQTRHAAAPRLAVMEDLGDTGDLVPWVANTALFNWSPAKTSATYDAFKVVHLSTNWDAFGFFMTGGLAGEETLWLHVKGASFGDEDLHGIARELELLTSWLVNPANWEKSANDCRAL